MGRRRGRGVAQRRDRVPGMVRVRDRGRIAGPDSGWSANRRGRHGVLRRRRPGYLPGRNGGRRSGGGGSLLLGILLLVGIGLLLWFFLSRGGGDTAAGEANAQPSAGTVSTTDGADVFSASNDASGRGALEGQTVRGEQAPVVSVVNDSAFWVGQGNDRLLVVVSPAAGRNPTPNIGAGDTVDFSGIIRVLPADFQQRFGVSGQEDVARLEAQDHYIEALSVTVN
jgi:hypothetical protein